MSNKLFNPPLELVLAEETIQFNSVADIAFGMEGRTAISSTKLSELFKLSVNQLEAHAKNIASTKQSLISILSNVSEDPDGLAQTMRQMDPQVFSQDRDWRQIVLALHEADDSLNPLRMTVLSKYVKYLYALEDTIEEICEDRKSAGESLVDNEDATFLPKHIESASETGEQARNEFKRLPYDKEVSVKLLPGERMDVRLASYDYEIVASDDAVQFIEDGMGTILGRDGNMIGRGPNSTVKVDVTKKTISRSHLRIVIGDDHILKLTDLSTAGTFLSTEFSS